MRPATAAAAVAPEATDMGETAAPQRNANASREMTKLFERNRRTGG